MGGVRSLTENSVNFFFFFESFPYSYRYLILKLLTGDAMEEYCSQNSCRVSVGDVGGAKTRYAISFVFTRSSTFMKKSKE